MSSDQTVPYRMKVKPGDQGSRLDQFLVVALARDHGLQLSRRAVRRAIDSGSVFLGGQQVRIASRSMRVGSKVEAWLDPASDPRSAGKVSRPPDLSDRILFEDAFVIAVDKPSGLLTQSTVDDAWNNVVEGVRRYLGEGSNTAPSPYVALHHRLDRGTSGVLVLAKHERANAGLARVFGAAAASAQEGAAGAAGEDGEAAGRSGAVEKVYDVLVGLPASLGLSAGDRFLIDEPLVKDGRKMAPALVGEGLPASTEVRVLGVAQSTDPSAMRVAAWLEARPRTGRKHQIRAHLAARGMPVLGDRLYGAAPGSDDAVHLRAPRPMLHAGRLSLAHPIYGRPLLLRSLPPEDFLRQAADLGLREVEHEIEGPGELSTESPE